MTQEEISGKLFNAVCRGDKKNIIKYIAAGADVNTTAFHWPPLYKAIGMNYEEGVSLLISAGADVNYIDVNGSTALHKAAMDNSAGCIRLLLDAGANVDGTGDIDSDTPLYNAALWGNIEAMRILIEAGADVNFKNRFGTTC